MTKEQIDDFLMEMRAKMLHASRVTISTMSEINEEPDDLGGYNHSLTRKSAVKIEFEVFPREGRES